MSRRAITTELLGFSDLAPAASGDSSRYGHRKTQTAICPSAVASFKKMCTAAVSVAVAAGKHVLGSVTVARLTLVQSIRVRLPAEKPSRDRVQVTHRPHKPGHAGSIPAPATNTGQPSGDVLPPYCLPHHLRVAQLVEHPAVNREVAGSRPAAQATPPWFKGRTPVFQIGYAGSIPAGGSTVA